MRSAEPEGAHPRTLEEEAVGRAASVILAVLRADDRTCAQLGALLIESGRVAGDGHELADSHYDEVVGGALGRFFLLLGGLLPALLTQAIEEDAEHLAAIRAFFLDPRDHYSLEELAALWRMQVDDVRNIYHDELLRQDEPGVCVPDRSHWNGPRALEAEPTKADFGQVAWIDAIGASVVLNLIRAFDIERALGADFSHVRPEAWRTVPFLIHIPQFIADALAADACIPPGLAVHLRIEQFLIELFTSDSTPGRNFSGAPYR